MAGKIRNRIGQGGSESPAQHGVELERNRLRGDLAAAQAVLADREAALARAEMAIAQTDERRQQEVAETKTRYLNPDRIGFVREVLKQRDEGQIKSQALRNLVVAILLVAPGIAFYPRIASLFPESPQALATRPLGSAPLCQCRRRSPVEQ